MDDTSIAPSLPAAGRDNALSVADLAAMLDMAVDWTFEFDAEGCFTKVSDTIRERAGISPKMLLGRKREAVFAQIALSPRELEEHMALVAERKPFRDFKGGFGAGQGTFRYFTTSGTPIFAPDGTYCGYRGVARDISGLVSDSSTLGEIQRKLDESRDMMTSVFSSLGAALVVYDGTNKLYLANQTMRGFYPGIDPRLLTVGAQLEDFLDAIYELQAVPEANGTLPERAGWIADRLKRYHEPHCDYDVELRDGRWIRFVNQRLENGLFIGLRSDITEQKQRERDLVEAQKRAELADRAKSEFLANMSHEIRTPMNGVLGMAELLSKTELTGKQRTFADIIVKSGNALLTIINDILDFSKIDAGQLVLDPAPFNLAEAIEDVATLISVRAREKDLELAVRFDPSLPRCFTGDAGRIRQIITNLMGNAVKFTETGHVLVDVTGAGSGPLTRIRVSVSDTGIGIAQDKLDSVFEKFSQVDGSSTRRHEGTGLGLAIASRLVELMGGRIGANSAPGEGSTFWIELDLPARQEEKKTMAMPIDVTGARVVIIDDNEVNRAILLEQMASWSFDACAAASGEEGIAILKAARGYGLEVDCVVLDYQMPGMNGEEVAAAINAHPLLSGIPVVLLSSVDHSLAGEKSSALGIAACLVKPARSSALMEAIVSAVQRRRTELAATVAGVPERAVPSKAKADEFSFEPPRKNAPRPHRVDILAAEDNEVNQLVLTQILQESGYSFTLVSHGEAAVEAWLEMHPRLVLMDVSMPQMNGLEATAHIRRAEQRGGLERSVIIGVTAHALKGDKERCLESGMDDYLSKPISPDALLAKLEKWMGQTHRAKAAG